MCQIIVDNKEFVVDAVTVVIVLSSGNTIVVDLIGDKIIDVPSSNKDS